MANVSVRHAEPDDAQAIHRILCGPQATAGTLQLPLQSVEGVRTRFFSDTREGLYHLVACVDEEVVGHLGLETRRSSDLADGTCVRSGWPCATTGRVRASSRRDGGRARPCRQLDQPRTTGADALADNAAGIALYEKFGFAIEGTHRLFAFRN
jgi:L-phenylalanine/L-methionine N-acetyltransferase